MEPNTRSRISEGANIAKLASASKRRLNVFGLLHLTIAVGGHVAGTTFLVAEEREADVILVCQYTDAAVGEVEYQEQNLSTQKP